MRKQLNASGPIKGYLGLAKRMVADPDNHCRWQAFIVIDGFVERNPELVWPIIEEHATSTDDDIRMAVATNLLEYTSLGIGRASGRPP